MILFKNEAADLIVLGMFGIWADDIFWFLMVLFGRVFRLNIRKPEGMPRKLAWRRRRNPRRPCRWGHCL